MHACLNVDEIVRLIAHELVAFSGEGSAAGLACCCKSFEDPVLDELWAKQVSLLPLFNSFPGDVWKGGGYSVSAPTTCLFSLSLISIVLQKTPDDDGMGSSPEVRSKDARAQTIQPSRLPVPRNFLGHPALHHQRTLAPEFENSQVDGNTGVVYTIHPLVLSTRITSITLGFKSDLPEAMIASTITTLPRLCPDLQAIDFYDPPRNPATTAAISGMLLVTNREVLQEFCADSLLTEEASEVLYGLPNLRKLSVAIERETPLPPVSLPNLTKLTITCNNEDDWPRLFHGATLGKLEDVNFHLQSEQVGDFLEAFEKAALSSSVQNTLSKFYIFAQHSRNPNYSSLLPFKQLVDLEIEIPCDDDGCSSRVDDDIIINLSRAMPKLETLALGDPPCDQSTGGVTTKGLLALAHHCPKLSTLCVHFRVASLSEPPEIPGMIPGAGPAASWTGCALTEFVVGTTPVPEGSAMIIALTLLWIFPRLDSIGLADEEWEEVRIEISRSKEIIGYSSKQRPFIML